MKKESFKTKRILAILCLCAVLGGCVADIPDGQTTTAESSTPTTTTETEPGGISTETIETTESTESIRTEPVEDADADAPKLIPLNTMTDDEINALDSTCRDYGMGYETDDSNRPVGGLMIQEEIEGYSANVLLNSDTEIYLTFDQGYENGYTAAILDTLKEKNAKAIFFLTGDYAERNHELVQRMIDEGHILGNHGMKHKSLPTLSIEEAEEEIMSLHNYVLECYGYEMTYFRPPQGQYSEKSLAITQRLGYKTFLWSFAYADWDVNSQPEPEAAFERISTAAHGGEICLLHSVSETNAGILGRVIDSMREQGFTLALPNI